MPEENKISFSDISLPDNSNSYHFHRQYEIIYLIEGDIYFYSEGKTVHADKSCIFIIPPFTPHKTDYKSAKVCRVVFDGSYLYKYFTEETVKKIIAGFNSSFLFKADIDKRPFEIMENLRNDIINKKSVNSYLYLYQLIYETAVISRHKNSNTNKTIIKILNYIKLNAQKKLTLEMIASENNLSRFYICKLFKRELGISAVNYITFIKIKYATELLCENEMTVTQISQHLSFSSPKYFTKTFKQYFGIPPSNYIKLSPKILGQSYKCSGGEL